MRQFIEKIGHSIAAGGLAIDADFAFHRAISTATGNPYFERFMFFPRTGRHPASVGSSAIGDCGPAAFVLGAGSTRASGQFTRAIEQRDVEERAPHLAPTSGGQPAERYRRMIELQPAK